jgi:hypothetical protein
MFYTQPGQGKLNSGLPTAMKTIMPVITPERAALARGRIPRKAVTENSVTARGTMLQVGETPPKTPCHIVLMGAAHIQCGTRPRITMGISKAPTDLPRCV